MKGAVRRLFYWRGAGERDVPDAVFALVVFLPDALRDDSDRFLGVVAWPECAAERRVGAESEADDGCGARLIGAIRRSGR